MAMQLKTMSGYDCQNKCFQFLTKCCEWWYISYTHAVHKKSTAEYGIGCR